MKKFLLPILLGLAVTLSCTLSAAERTYDILLIQSYTDRTPFHALLTKGLKDGLSKGGVKANVTTEYINADYWSYVSECVIMRRICERARGRHTDLIVTVGDEAFYDLMTCGDSLGHRLPVIVSGIKYPNEKLMEHLPNVAGFTAKTDFKGLLYEIKRIFPNRKEIICLSDSALLSYRGTKKLEDDWLLFQQENPEYTFLKKNVQTQAPTAIISSICYDYNAYNRVVIAPKWSPFLSFIGKNSKAPVFTGQNLALTNGVFCAYDVVPSEGTCAAGKLAARILQGKVAVSSCGIVNLDGTFLYDYKQLDFFRVDSSIADGHGIIMNIPFNERYGIWLILFYSIIVVVLVIWLIRSNRKEARRRIQAQTRLLIQARLVEQRNEFDDIFCSIRDGLISYDTDLRIHFVNHSLMLMLGLSPETHTARFYEGQIAGSIFHIYVDGEDILTDLLKNACELQKAVPIPANAFMRENVQGIYFPVSGEVVPVFAKGRMTGMALVCRNISEEERQKRFFNMAIEESSVYPWQYDMSQQCFVFPAGLFHRLGHRGSVETMTLEDVRDIVHPNDREATHAIFAAILQGHMEKPRMSFRVRKADGGYEWWEFRFTIYNGLTEDDPYMVLGVAQSIQRYKDTEDALITARDHAMQADKLKSAFLANMSHEIRTPLNAIVGFSDLLKDLNAFSKEEVQEFVGLINTNCTLLLALINDILDLSRIEAGTMEFNIAEFNLNYIMQDIYDSQYLSMPQGVELRIECPVEEGKSIQTDIVRLKQVVNNLVNNAKKFTVQGSITIGYTVDEPEYTTVYVEDTGKGIPEEAAKHIFERFYKVDNFVQGAGLGLSICQTIVEHLRGTISVFSQVGRGTRFEVRMPDVNE